jgi:hypothetical protein
MRRRARAVSTEISAERRFRIVAHRGALGVPGQSAAAGEEQKQPRSRLTLDRPAALNVQASVFKGRDTGVTGRVLRRSPWCGCRGEFCPLA